MSREIKFRAWTGKHWINEGMLYNYQETTYLESCGFLDEELPIMQFTNLYDKNKKEIYEHDIVSINMHGPDGWEKNNVIVIFTYGHWNIADDRIFSTETAEVVGNLYEGLNPKEIPQE